MSHKNVENKNFFSIQIKFNITWKAAKYRYKKEKNNNLLVYSFFNHSYPP